MFSKLRCFLGICWWLFFHPLTQFLLRCVLLWYVLGHGRSILTVALQEKIRRLVESRHPVVQFLFWAHRVRVYTNIQAIYEFSEQHLGVLFLVAAR